MAYYDEAVDFLKSISKKHGVIIVYNNDMDGMASCALLVRHFESHGIKPYIIYQPMPPEKNFLRRVQTSLPDIIIFLDMAMDNEPGLIRKLSGVSKIIIIDHHVIVRNMNLKRIVHVNPRFEKPEVYQSTAYVMYKILSSMKACPQEWIAMLGAVGDYNLDYSGDLVKKATESLSLKQYSSIVNVIEAARISKEISCDEIVDALVKAESPDDITQRKDFAKAASLVEDEISREINDAYSNMERCGNLLMYHSNSKYNLRSVISTKISTRHPDKLVVVYGLYGKKMIGSVRNQKGNINTIEALARAASGITGISHGGHYSASGFSVPENKWDEFRQNLVKIAEGF